MQTHIQQKFTATDKKIITLASLGGMLEFYDFIIYGVFAAYFAADFFPTHNVLLSIIETYVVFVLGYIARPIGGIFFSHIGDEHGRKQVLVTTIVLMGLSSLGIGFLPTYAQIGVAAPILLLILRLIQGLALGGELPSTYVYIRESIPHRAKVAFGILMCGIVSGLLLGMFINVIITHLYNHQQISSFGWRIPFIFGGFLCLISYKIRKQLAETSVFKHIADKPDFPLVYLLKNHLAGVAIGTGVTATLAASIVVFVIFMPTYLFEIIKLDVHFVSVVVVLITITNLAIAYIIGYITEKFDLDLNRAFKYLVVLCAIVASLSYWYGSVYSFTYVSLIPLGMISGIFTMLSPAIITTLFPAKVRLSGVALCYNLGFSVFGGLAPVIITTAIKSGMNHFLSPLAYILIIYLMGLISVSCINKNS